MTEIGREEARISEEQIIGFMRQYFPKGINLADVSQTKPGAVARQHNERSRKTLGYETPASGIDKLLRLSVELKLLSGFRHWFSDHRDTAR